MSTLGTSASSNGRCSHAWSRPSINAITATTVAELDEEVDAIGRRLGRFDHDAIARTKSSVDRVTLPANLERSLGQASVRKV